MGLSWGLKIAIISIALVVIAGAVTFHFVTVADYERIVAAQKTEIAGLKTDKEKLETSNASLETAMAKKDEVNKQMLQQLANIAERDKATQQQLIDAQRKLASAERTRTLTTLRQSDKAEDLLSKINKNAACEITHFGELGSCKNGVWQPVLPPSSPPR